MFSSALRKTDLAGLHFGSIAEIEAEIPELRASDYLVSEISARAIRNEKDLFEAIKTKFNAPYDAITNWDAMEEVLNDLTWLPRPGYILIIRHCRILWLQNYDIAAMLV